MKPKVIEIESYTRGSSDAEQGIPPQQIETSYLNGYLAKIRTFSVLEDKIQYPKPPQTFAFGWVDDPNPTGDYDF
jgi:hypothetical protein